DQAVNLTFLLQHLVGDIWSKGELFTSLKSQASRLCCAIAYFGLERLMRAVLAPCLRQGLQLAIGGRALFLTKIALDGLHLGQVECEHAGLANPQEFDIVGVEQRHASDLRRGWRRLVQQVDIK